MLEKPRPLAYSYVRFSSKRQEHGDSLRRQIEMAETYAKEHNLRLSAQSFRDLGVSGFKQRNLKQGALAAFISAVRSGTIEPGSYLLIEQFDRLSRAEVTVAFRLLLDLIEAGVTVVTLVDRKVWNEESIQDVVNVHVVTMHTKEAHRIGRKLVRPIEVAPHLIQDDKVARLHDSICRTTLRVVPKARLADALVPNADETSFNLSLVLADELADFDRVQAFNVGDDATMLLILKSRHDFFADGFIALARAHDARDRVKCHGCSPFDLYRQGGHA